MPDSNDTLPPVGDPTAKDSEIGSSAADSTAEEPLTFRTGKSPLKVVSALGLRLREANAELLEQLFSESFEEMGPGEIEQVLRNPFLTSQLAREIAQSTRLTAHYDVRRDLTFHVKTPEVFAQRFVSGLRWRDLAKLSSSIRVRPLVKRQAEMALSNRLPGLSLGEKITLARIAGTGLLHQFRLDTNPRVISAMLDNPRLTAGIVSQLLNDPRTQSEILREVARHGRWGNRYEVRLGLARNRNTPAQLALDQLSMLKKADLRSMSKDGRLRANVRDRARLLAGS